ncbi:MAG: hypothetical protein WC465_02150 [Patescibacteria group bacterium]
MASIFKKKKNYRKEGPKNRPRLERHRPRTSDKDLVDPVAYCGDLDLGKYPVLPPTKKEEQEFDVENPLNKR